MKPYQTIVNCAVNHYRFDDEIKFSSLMRFIKLAGKQVFERELTEIELDQAFRFTMAALFE